VRDYELVLVVSPQADSDGATAVLQRVKRFVAEHGGAVTEEEQWGLRRLAYPIKKFREGNYFLTRFRLEPNDAKELEEAIKLSEQVIRHLLLKVEA